MQISHRQSVLGLMMIGIVATLAVTLFDLMTNQPLTRVAIDGAAVLAFSGLLYAYWRGWDTARYVTVVIITALLIPSIDRSISGFAMLAAPLMALILANPAWVIGSAVAMYVAVLVLSGNSSAYSNVINVFTYAFIIGGLVLSRLVLDSALRIAKSNARRAEENAQRAEAQAADLARKAAELEQQNEQQQRLLDLVSTLETPAVALAEGVLLAPVVGHLDSRRAQALTTRLLNEVSAQRTRLVILDIAGVAMVDTQVAQAIVRAGQALRLLGCEVTITGISASVATTITHLGISLEGIATARTPQEALARPEAMPAPSVMPPTNGHNGHRGPYGLN